jgi:rhodanese-related sulfurtransferase
MINITPQEAQELIKKRACALDVRTKEEYAGGHVPDAMNIDISSSTFEEEIGRLDKSKQYVVNCQSGGRSSRAATRMEELGFTDACNVSGGIIAWKNAGLPVV